MDTNNDVREKTGSTHSMTVAAGISTVAAVGLLALTAILLPVLSWLDRHKPTVEPRDVTR